MSFFLQGRAILIIYDQYTEKVKNGSQKKFPSKA